MILDDSDRYKRLVSKLNYLIITRPDIAFCCECCESVSLSTKDHSLKCSSTNSQVLKEGSWQRDSNCGHTRVVRISDVDWAGTPVDRWSNTGFYVFLGGNHVSWKSKKQSMVSRSSTKLKYRAIVNVTCKVVWVKNLLTTCEVVWVKDLLTGLSFTL